MTRIREEEEEWYNIQLYTYNSRPIESRIMIYRTAPFSMTLNDPYPQFQATLFFDAISETVRDT